MDMCMDACIETYTDMRADMGIDLSQMYAGNYSACRKGLAERDLLTNK